MNPIKKIILKRKIKKNIKNRVNDSSFDFKKIQNILCIFEADIVKNLDFVRNIAVLFSVKPENCTFLPVSRDKKNGDSLTYDQINFLGRINNDKFRDILMKKYDILLNCFLSNDPEILLLSTQAKTLFRIGFETVGVQYNDLIIKCDITETEVFVNQIEKVIKTMQ